QPDQRSKVMRKPFNTGNAAILNPKTLPSSPAARPSRAYKTYLPSTGPGCLKPLQSSIATMLRRGPVPTAGQRFQERRFAAHFLSMSEKKWAEDRVMRRNFGL